MKNWLALLRLMTYGKRYHFCFAMDAVRTSDILAHYPVQKVMSLNPKTTSPDTPLMRKRFRLMLENHISTLPVMKGEKLVGIITESDIAAPCEINWGEIPVENQ